MKLRIKGNTVRFRLTRPEVEYFATEGYIEEILDFGNVKFIYALSKSDKENNLAARFEENKISLFIPKAMATVWTTTERVGFESEMDVGNGKKLYILLEKDFKCLDNTIEDQTANYPNPLARE